MIRLHHCHQTRSMRTLWLLYELDVAIDLQVYPFDKTLRGPDFKALNPIGRVPALEIDGDVMTETGAMAEYLCDKFPDAGLGRVPGDRERMDWLVWLHFAETLSQHSAALTQQHVALYDDCMRSPIVMKLEAARLANCFRAVEQRLNGRDYLLDTGFSAVDIGVGQAIYMGQHFVRLDPFPALCAWFERIAARPAYQRSLPAPGDVGLYSQDFYDAWDITS